MADFTSNYPRRSRSPAKSGSAEDHGPIPEGLKRHDFALLTFEKQIIALTVEGYSTGEAARKIGIRESTLTQCLLEIFDRLHVSNLFELILFALYHQLTESQDSSASGQRILTSK